jgi:DNA replication and repair protein RecF
VRVQHLRLCDYRNIQEAQFLPCPGVNVLYGENAQGKTNLLEGIWLFTGGRSFRGARDAELVRFGGQRAELAMEFAAQEREMQGELLIEGGRRTAVLNHVPLGPASALVGKFCAVVFSPQHLSLARDGPAERRRFLDAAICQLKPAYAALLSRYQHTLTQRNALLKDIPRHAELMDTLDIWDEKLARTGAAVARARYMYVERLRAHAEEAYRGIADGREGLSIRYSSALGEETTAERFYAALVGRRGEDVAAGFTSCGPHRDDMELQLDGRPVRTFGSQGQQRSSVLALKLAEATLLTEGIGERPVILLDDVLSELDAVRQDYLLNHLDGWQVFLTCCDPAPVLRLAGGLARRVRAGELLEPDV